MILKKTSPKQLPSQTESTTQRSSLYEDKTSLLSRIARLLGKLIPSISLVLLLVLISIITLLSLVGIPSFIINKVEEAARQEGIHLYIKSARLSYGSGLGIIIKDSMISLDDELREGEGAQRHLEIGRAELNLRISPLLQGEISPYLLKISNGSFTILGQENEQLEVQDINISATLSNNNIIKIASHQPLDVQGIKLDFKADIPKASIFNADKTAKPKAPTDESIGQQVKNFLQGQSANIKQFHEIILQQEWMLQQDSPEIKLSLNAINDINCSFELYFPSCSYKNVTLDQLRLNAAYTNKALIIHKLTAHTTLVKDEQQKAQISLQGGYDITDKHLAFTLDSKLPLFNIANDLLQSVDIDYLANIPTSSKYDSNLRLEGNIYLRDSLELKKVDLIGYMMQQELQVGTCLINELELSFFLNDDSFAIDKARLKMEESELSAQSQLKDGKGSITLKSNLTAAQILSLKDGLQSTKQATQLPDQLQVLHPLVLEARALIDTPEQYRGKQPFINYIPQIDKLSISLSTEEIKYKEHQLKAPNILLSLEELFKDQQQVIKTLQANISAQQIKSSINEQVAQGKNIELQVKMEDIGRGEKLDWHITQALGELSAQELQYDELHIQNATLSLKQASEICYPAQESSYLNNAKAEARLSKIDYQGTSAKELQIKLDAQSLDDFSAQVQLLLNEQEDKYIKLSLRRSDKEKLKISSLAATLPTSILNQSLPKELWEQHGLSLLDSDISIKGSASLKLNDDESCQLESLHLDLHLPRLERSTTAVPALKDKRNVLDVEAILDLNYNDERELQYKIPYFKIQNERGKICGNAYSIKEGTLTIRANSDMRADLVDELLGDLHTHRIIRDFAFEDKSKVLLNNADIDIDYSDGLDIKVNSDVELEHVKLVLGHYKTILDANEEPTINEELNTEDIAKLYSHITRGDAKLVVDVEIGKKEEGAEKAPLEKSLISINDITLVFDNRPWLQFKKIKGGVTSSTLKSKSVVLNTKDNDVSIHEAQGSIYPDYAIGTFFYPLRRHLKILELTQPAMVESKFCQFPIMKKSKIPMAGNIKISSQHLINLLFNKNKIPLRKLSGFISFGKKTVFLDKLNAYTWNGVLNGKLRLGLLKDDVSYDGEITATGLNLQEILKTFDVKQAKARCEAYLRFQSASSKLADLKGYGKLKIYNGDLLKLRIFSPISDLLSNISQLVDIQKYIINDEREQQDLNLFQHISGGISRAAAKGVEYAHGGMKWVGGVFGSTTDNIPSANHLLKYNLQNAEGDFEITKGHIISQNMQASGSNLSLTMSISIDLKNKYVNANIWPNISSLLSIMLSPITSISNYIIDINIFGPIDKLDWKIKLQTGASDNIKEIMNKASFRKDKNAASPKS